MDVRGKQDQRRAALAARMRLAPEERAAASKLVAARLESLPAFAGAGTLALYAPLGAEVDTLEIARGAQARGVRIAWPALRPGSRVLAFKACAAEALLPGSLGFREPPGDAPEVELERLDCILVPGLAFDETCHRLGRGGGHYDATLAALPARVARIGLAFECQVLPAVPRDPHDAPVDLVVTERRLLARGGATGCR